MPDPTITITFCATCPGHERRCATDSTITSSSTQAQVTAVLDSLMENVADQVEDDGCVDLANKLRGAL